MNIYGARSHNIEVVTFIDNNSFNSFRQSGDYHSIAYSKIKERISQKLLNSLEKVIPEIRNKIIRMELGTPLTNEFYLNGTSGNVYGTESKVVTIAAGVLPYFALSVLYDAGRNQLAVKLR